MNTELVRIDPDHIDPSVMARAGGILRRGGLCAFPTETVYGLGGDALNPEASGKIYAAKGRPSDNPLIVHIADMEHLPAIAAEIPPKAEQLAAAFWPGPLTMILNKTAAVPRETTGGLDTVAVRMPGHGTALALIRAAGGYVAAPSANTSGRPSPTCAEHVVRDLWGRIDMIIDSGSTEIGLESTIVDFTEDAPVILRPGYVNRQMLESVIGEVRIDPGLIHPDESRGVRPKAPGMRYRHYAPKAQLYVVEGGRDGVAARINRLAEEQRRLGRRTGVIAADETAGLYSADVVMRIGSRREETSIARHLFAVLRSMDDEDVDVIYSESFNTPVMGMAVMNRLLKAAGHQVIEA